MAIPYTEAEADELGTHVSRRHMFAWRYVEDVYKHVGADGWKDVKEVWYKSGGTWRLVHEGEHFLFKTTLSTNAENQWSLSTYITGQGYTGNKIKGVVVVNNAQQRVNLNNSSDITLSILKTTKTKFLLETDYRKYFNNGKIFISGIIDQIF